MNDEFLNKPYFFNKNDHFIRNLIKELGYGCCRGELPEEHVLWCVENFSHGYAIVDKFVPEKFEYFLKAYILFLVNPISNIIEGRILCSNEFYKSEYDSILLDCVKTYGENSGFARFDILAFPSENLSFYKNLGFSIKECILDTKGNFKVIQMSMLLT